MKGVFAQQQEGTMINVGRVCRSNLAILFAEFIEPSDIIALHAFFLLSKPIAPQICLFTEAREQRSKTNLTLSFRDEDEATLRKTFAFDGHPKKQQHTSEQMAKCLKSQMRDGKEN